jgi:hypothetical protein
MSTTRWSISSSLLEDPWTHPCRYSLNVKPCKSAFWKLRDLAAALRRIRYIGGAWTDECEYKLLSTSRGWLLNKLLPGNFNEAEMPATVTDPCPLRNSLCVCVGCEDRQSFLSRSATVSL